MKAEIKIISKSGVLPTYETEGSAGADLRAYLDEPAWREKTCTNRPIR